MLTKSKRRSVARGRWIAVFFVLIIGFSFLFYFCYQSSFSFFVSSYTSSFKDWMSKRKKHFYQAKIKVKQLKPNKPIENEPEIHFEFYTALPNMQIPVPDIDLTKNQKIKRNKENKKIIVQSKPVIFNADRLEQEWSAEIKENANAIHR